VICQRPLLVCKKTYSPPVKKMSKSQKNSIGPCLDLARNPPSRPGRAMFFGQGDVPFARNSALKLSRTTAFLTDLRGDGPRLRERSKPIPDRRREERASRLAKHVIHVVFPTAADAAEPPRRCPEVS